MIDVEEFLRLDFIIQDIISFLGALKARFSA
jgi:hypothetical protein